MHVSAVCRACMSDGLHNGDVCVRKRNVLAYETDGQRLCCVLLHVNHVLPLGEVRLSVLKTKVVARGVRQTCFLKHERNSIQRRSGEVRDNVLLADVAEACNLLHHVLRDLAVAAENQHVRLDADGEQLLYAVLGRLCFKLVAAGDERKQSNVNVHYVLSADVVAHLADSLEERCGLDIADCTADLGDNYVGSLCAAVGNAVDAVLYFVGHVRDDLNGSAEVVAAALLVKNCPVDLTGGDIAVY